jgi:uncharacterized protein (DUF1330 family)
MKIRLLSTAMAFALGCFAATWFLTADHAAVNAQETKTKPKDERIFMLNVLWFKEDGGAAKYMEYMKASGPFAIKHGAKTDGAYLPGANIIGKFDADLVFFVEWPNKQAFLNLIQDPGYQAISHLRDEAISDSLLIQCARMQ